MELVFDKKYVFDMYVNPFNIKKDNEITIMHKAPDNILILDMASFYYNSEKDQLLLEMTSDDENFSKQFKEGQAYRLSIESNMQGPGISSSFSSGYGLFTFAEIDNDDDSVTLIRNNPDESILRSLFTDLLKLVHNLYDYKEGTITIKLERFAGCNLYGTEWLSYNKKGSNTIKLE